MTRVRPATPTVAFLDPSWAQYRGLFHNVRHCEPFTALPLGLLAETRRQSLPRLGKAVHADPQALHHGLAHADWSVEALRRQRLDRLRPAVGDRPVVRGLDEPGDRQKGQTTDSVAPQYLGTRHPLANGSGAVNASGLLGTTPFPLRLRRFKPESRLKPGDGSKRQPQVAIAILEELVALGLRFSGVLAESEDGEDGESGAFTGALHRWGRPSGVAIRSTQGVWMRAGQRVRQTRGRPFDRVFADGRREPRFIREPSDGTRQAVRSSPIPTDPAPRPSATTGDLMTTLPGTLTKTVGNPFGQSLWAIPLGNPLGLRTWGEDGFKPAKDDLGWADDRVTDAAAIERWWELVMSASTLVSVQRLGDAAHDQPATTPRAEAAPEVPLPDDSTPLEAHPAWDTGSGWKHHLNPLRLLLHPYGCSCRLLPGLQLVPLPHLQAVQTGLAALGSLVNTCRLALPT